MIKNMFTRLAVSAVALWITSLFAQQLDLPLRLTTVGGALLAVLALTVVNALVKPIINILALPLRFMTLGLIGIPINALLFWSVTLLNIKGFEVGDPTKPDTLATIGAAFFGSVVLGIVGAILNVFVKPNKRKT